jgi:hypothetical protein
VAEHVHRTDGNHKLCLPESLNQLLSELLSADASSAVDYSFPVNLGTYLQENMVYQEPPHFCGLNGWKSVAVLPGFQVTAMAALLETVIQHFVELVVHIRQMLVITVHRY